MDLTERERKLTEHILHETKERKAYAKHAQEHRSGGFDPLLELGSAPGNPGKEYDFWVCSSGGTHTTLFGTGGALTAAWTYNKNFVTIYVCSGHTESVAAAYSFATAPLFNTLSIISLGQNPAQVQVGPLFTLGAGITSFFNRTYTTANPIDSLTFTNINFSSNGQAGCSIFTGSRPVGNYTDFFNCGLIQIDYPFNVTNMISDTAVTFSNSFLSAYTTPSAIIKQTGTDVSSGTIPAAYQTGLFLIECDVELYDTMIGGVGCGIKFLQNIVVHNSNLLLSSHTTDLSWIDLKIGGAYNVGGTGTYNAGMTRHPHIRVTDNRIEWAVATGRTAPFMASTTASGTFLIGHLVCTGNTVAITNGTAALAGTFFANMGGTAGPHNLNITGNSIALDTNTGTGTAITFGANTLNARVDNVYRGFATNYSGPAAAGAVDAPATASYITTDNETASLPSSRYLYVGNDIYATDAGPGGILTLHSWMKGADVASANPLAAPLGYNYFHVTGTTGFASITSSDVTADGYRLLLEFDGALTITHHATNLILQGATNYTTAAGDVLEFVAENDAATQWREINRHTAAASPPAHAFVGASHTGDDNYTLTPNVLGLGFSTGDLIAYSDAGITEKARWGGTTGHIGIGIAPAVRDLLGFNETFTDPAGNLRALSGTLAMSLTGASTRSSTGVDILESLSGGFATTGIFTGFKHSISQANVGSTIADVRGFWSTAALSRGATDRYGLRVDDASGTVTNQYGIYIANMTLGGTINRAIQSLGGLSTHLGAFRIGSNTAPTNTTDGDITGTRLIVPNATLVHSAISQLGGPVVIPLQGALRFSDTDDSNYTGFKAASVTTATVEYTWPPADGTSGYQLTTDGLGTLSWAAAGAGGGGAVATDVIWDAKGDLAAGTGADTAAKLTVGADDTILMADSAQATGLKWVASASPSAVGTAAVTGTGDTFTRGDHVHAHEAAHINHDTTWAAAGDLIYGTANDTAAILGIGTGGFVLAANTGATAPAYRAETHCVQFYIPDADVASTTIHKGSSWVAPVAGAITAALQVVTGRNGVATAGTVDVHKIAAASITTDGLGTTIFTTQSNRPALASSVHQAASGAGVPEVSTFAAGDRFIVLMDVASNVPEVEVHMFWRPT